MFGNEIEILEAKNHNLCQDSQDYLLKVWYEYGENSSSFLPKPCPISKPGHIDSCWTPNIRINSILFLQNPENGPDLKLDSGQMANCVHKWTLVKAPGPHCSEDILRVMKSLQPLLNHRSPVTYSIIFCLAFSKNNVPTLLYSPWKKILFQVILKSQKFSIWGAKRCVNVLDNTYLKYWFQGTNSPLDPFGGKKIQCFIKWKGPQHL